MLKVRKKSGQRFCLWYSVSSALHESTGAFIAPGDLPFRNCLSFKQNNDNSGGQRGCSESFRAPKAIKNISNPVDSIYARRTLFPQYGSEVAGTSMQYPRDTFAVKATLITQSLRLQKHSNSKLCEKLGRNLTEGFVRGIQFQALWMNHLGLLLRRFTLPKLHVFQIKQRQQLCFRTRAAWVRRTAWCYGKTPRPLQQSSGHLWTLSLSLDPLWSSILSPSTSWGRWVCTVGCLVGRIPRPEYFWWYQSWLITCLKANSFAWPQAQPTWVYKTLV